MALKAGDTVKFNRNWWNRYQVEAGEEFTVRRVKTLPKGTTKGASLGVLNMCKKRDVEVVWFKNHPAGHSPIAVRFLSKVKK